ncbi:MAG: ABC transporter ATP-binding protein [Patescibacteria group bacterium]
MWQFSAGNRPKVIFYFLLQIGSNLINLCGPLILAGWLNYIQQNGVNSENIYRVLSWLPLFLLVTLLSWAMHGPARVIEICNGFTVKVNYKNHLVGGILALPLKWHGEHHSGNTIDKVQKGSTALGDFSEETYDTIRMLTRLIGSYFVLIFFNHHAAYLILLTAAIASFIVVKFDKILIDQYYQLNRIENRIAEKIADAINNIRTVIILRIENLIHQSITKKMMSPYELVTKSTKLNETKWCLVSICASITKILVMGSYVVLTYKSGDAVLIGSLAALYKYVEEINDVFFNFASNYSQILKRRTKVANSEELTADFHLCRKITNSRMPSDWQEINIKNLTFSHCDDENNIDLHLDDISMTIRRNQRIAVIGASGSGKTTLLQIIRELYQPTSVNVYLDGKLIPKGFSSISSDVTLIPQDPEIFHASIMYNIAMDVDHDLNYVLRFTDMARFSDVVARLPNGFNSWINERGVNLSGGEKQRLALARGLMACDDKQIILLDEPTSSVDSPNELMIYKNIFAEFTDKTILSSIHKLHLLPMFDMIYFFDAGKIIASGTFQELLVNCPRFQEMWNEYNLNTQNQ